MCKCSNFPLFALLDSSYLSKPLSSLNQDLFCTYDHFQSSDIIFEQLKYFYYRFRTLTLANFPLIPTGAFRYVHFESQSVKRTEKQNNRNVIALINVEQTQSDIFHQLNLVNAHEQLIVSFLDSPRLIYTPQALSGLNCYELKLKNSNPKISIDFFRQVRLIENFIIENPSFTGFIRSSSKFEFQVYQIKISDIAVRHLTAKQFPLVFSSVNNLTLINRFVPNGFRSWNSRELSQCFPNVRRLKIYSRSIQRLKKRFFEHFLQLEYLNLNGITTIEDETFYNLYYLKELNLGKDIRQIDPYAFVNMNTRQLLLNQSLHFQLNDEKDFCSFAQFSPSSQLTTFVNFPVNPYSDCSCTLRYLYRHIDKAFLPLTPSCYSNATVYILTQEERICHFEQRLVQCDVLPDQEITIYGRTYNASDFYQQNLSKRRKRWPIYLPLRSYYYFSIGFVLLLVCWIFSRLRKRRKMTYRHLHQLLQRRQTTETQLNSTTTTLDRICQTTNLNSCSTIRTTKV